MFSQSILYVIVFAAVFFVIWSFNSLLPKNQKEVQGELPLLFRIFLPGIIFFSNELGFVMEKFFTKSSEKMRKEIIQSALSITVKELYGATVLFLLLGAVLAMMLASSLTLNVSLKILLFVSFTLVGGFLPRMMVQNTATKRVDEIMHNLPFSIDLISSSMNAGLDFGSAVRYLTTTGKPNVLKKEFSVFLQDISLGKTRTEALESMSERICVIEFTRFVSAISYGMDSGTSIIEIMRIQAEEMRRVKYARAEQQAAKAPIKMIVPTALFIFPAMFIIVGVAIYLHVKDSGFLNMFGQ